MAKRKASFNVPTEKQGLKVKKNKIVTERQMKERARRQAMPVAIIEKPLKFILSRDSYFKTDDEGKTIQPLEKVLGNTYKAAQIAAEYGYGRGVNYIARTLL